MKDLIAFGSKPIKTLFRSLAASTALALSAAIVLPAVSFADEDGVSFWLPGIYGSLAAVPEQPGFTFTFGSGNEQPAVLFRGVRMEKTKKA